jgi:hypothetical protein
MHRQRAGDAQSGELLKDIRKEKQKICGDLLKDIRHC